MKINNEQIKSACLLSQTQKYLLRNRSTTTMDEIERMTEIVTQEAAVMYDRWLAIETEEKTKNPDW